MGGKQENRMVHQQSGLDFKASEIGKNFGAKDLINSKIQMPSLAPPLQQIAIKVSKMILREASRGMGMGF